MVRCGPVLHHTVPEARGEQPGQGKPALRVGGHRLVQDDVDAPAVLRAAAEQAPQVLLVGRKRIDLPGVSPPEPSRGPSRRRCSLGPRARTWSRGRATGDPRPARPPRPGATPAPRPRRSRQGSRPVPGAGGNVSRARTVTVPSTRHRASKTRSHGSSCWSSSGSRWSSMTSRSLSRCSCRRTTSAASSDPTWRPRANHTVWGIVGEAVEEFDIGQSAGGGGADPPVSPSEILAGQAGGRAGVVESRMPDFPGTPREHTRGV